VCRKNSAPEPVLWTNAISIDAAQVSTACLDQDAFSRGTGSLLLLLLTRTLFEAQIMMALMLRDGQIERREIRAAAGVNGDLVTAQQRRMPAWGAVIELALSQTTFKSIFPHPAWCCFSINRGAAPCFKGQQTRSEYPPVNAHRATRRTRETGLSRGLRDLTRSKFANCRWVFLGGPSKTG
jgi:hypothetical protein